MFNTKSGALFDIYPVSCQVDFFLNLNHLQFCLATATHNFSWVKMYHFFLIRDLFFANSKCLTVHFVPNISDLINK